MNATRREGGPAGYQRAGLFLGPAIALTCLMLPPPQGLAPLAWRTAALGLLMAVWWATEALPVAATALVPVAVFPLVGVADIGSATAPFANPTIYLFLGGFMVALAVQRSGLHRRIALAVIGTFGASGASLVGGFMLASALLSMWVTNTSTTMMLLPIAVSVVDVVGRHLGDSSDARGTFPTAMLLGVAYGATIGGMATLVGTPPNALLAGFMLEHFRVEIGFVEWMAVGVPVTACLLPLSWWLLTRRLYPVRFTTSDEARGHLARLRADLGPPSRAERRVAAVFFGLALCWLTRPLLASLPGLAGLSDAGLAMLAGLVLFLIPSGDGRSALLRWGDTTLLPWGILLLFGGGLSLADAVSDTGLAEWLGQRLIGLPFKHLAVLVLALTTLIVFLTELTSNLATTATFLPVVAALAQEAGYAPIALAAPVALAASCAFMLPVATPPNAVVYGSGLLTIPQMVRAGFWLNLIAIVLVTLAALFLAPAFLG